MTKQDKFITLVQTYILGHAIGVHPKRELNLVPLYAAMQIPEEYIPNDVPLAVTQLMAFHFREGPRPEWVQAYEDGEKNRVTLRRVERGYDSPWWLFAEQESSGMPEECRELVCGRAASVEVSQSVAEAFFEWALGVRGWGQGRVPPIVQCMPTPSAHL